MKKISKVTALVVLFVCTITGLSFMNMSSLPRKAKDIQSVELSALAAPDFKADLLVSGAITYNFGAFARHDDEGNVDYNYYVITAGEHNNIFVAIKEPSSSSDAFARQIALTYDALVSGTNVSEMPKHSIEGTLQPITGELLEYYKDFFVENEIYLDGEIDEALNTQIMPYYISPISEIESISPRSLVIFAVISWIIGVCVFVFTFAKARIQTSDYDILNNRADNSHPQKPSRHTSLTDEMRDSDTPPLGFDDF